MKIEKLYRLYILFFIYIFLLLPLGSFLFFKSAIFLLFFYLFLIYLILKKLKLKKTFFLLSLIFLSFINLYILISMFNNFYEEEILRESFVFLEMFFIILILYIYMKDNIIDPVSVLKISLIAHLNYILIKIIMFFLIFKGIFDIDIVKSISKDFVATFFGNIPRITINNDLFSTIFLGLLITNSYIFRNRILYFSIVILLLLNIIISFNRISLISLLIIITISFFLFKEKIKILAFLISLLFIVMFILSLLYIYQNDLIVGIINTLSNRFSAEGSLSTGEKSYQYNLIFSHLEDNIFYFLFGKGMGQFLTEYIRYNISGYRFGYEAFWGILIYQFGILGFIFLWLMSNIKFLKKSCLNKPIIMNFIIYNLWLLHGILNPVILSANSAIIMFIILASTYINTKNR